MSKKKTQEEPNAAREIIEEVEKKRKPRKKKEKSVQEEIATQSNPPAEFKLDAKATKQPRKSKTIEDIVADMQKIEKKILDAVEKQKDVHSAIVDVARAYKAGFNNYSAAQKQNYRRLAGALQAR